MAYPQAHVSLFSPKGLLNYFAWREDDTVFESKKGIRPFVTLELAVRRSAK